MNNPLFSEDAESSVIGGVLLHPKVWHEVAAALQPDDFYHPALRAIYEAMAELERESRPLDALTVAERMRGLGTFDKLRAFKGAEYLTELMAKVVTVSNIGYHAKLVARKAERRRCEAMARELAAAALGEDDDEQYLERFEREVLAFTSRKRSDGGPLLLKPILHETIKAIGERTEHPGAITGIPSGFSELDEMTAGWQREDLVILAARPSMGKTSLAMDWVLYPGLNKNLPALVFSLEMSKRMLCERLLSSDANVDGSRLRFGTLQTADWVRLTSSASRLSGTRIWIEDLGVLTGPQISSRARRWRINETKADEPALIVVDYLQLITGAPQRRREQNRQQDISEISRGLKLLAKELRCPVIALSQLNRGVESRGDKRPMLSDLRESGALEQDADIIAFIYRDEVYSKDECKPEDKGIAEIIIAKHRMGPCGCVRLGWQESRTRFVNLARGRA